MNILDLSETIEFKYQANDNGRTMEVTSKSNSGNLDDTIEAFETFLKAVGYCWEGTIEIVPPQEKQNE